jgi:hypothetical protein
VGEECPNVEYGSNEVENAAVQDASAVEEQLDLISLSTEDEATRVVNAVDPFANLAHIGQITPSDSSQVVSVVEQDVFGEFI